MVHEFKCPSCGNSWNDGGAQLIENKIVCAGCLQEFKVVPKQESGKD